MSQDNNKEDAVQTTQEALDKATPQEAEAIAEQASFLTAREGQASGEHVHLTPEEEAARRKRNVAIAWGLVGFMVLIFLITVLRLSQNVANGAPG